MKSPIDVVKGRVVDYNPATEEITIIARYNDWFTLVKRNYQECLIQLIDSRPLSGKQRRSCYAMIHDISEYTGMGMEETKNWMKLKFIAEDLQDTADKLFSLSNASMSLICAFQNFLIDFILSWNIPTKYRLIDMVDDIETYVYSCLVHKRCCICGKPAVLHHWDRVGAGRNRETIDHIGLRAEPLCWEHHTECHSKTQMEFDSKYHISPVRIDKEIARIYGLNAKKKIQENSDA